MEYRKLGRSDLNVSCIGLGTWAIGSGSDWGTSDENECIKVIRQSIDEGINLIDTAPCYNFGHSEEVVGKAIKGIRDKVVISIKCGVWWNSNVKNFFYQQDNVTMHRSLKPETIKQEIELSLKRLDTDYIDLYHTHWPDPKTAIEETAECLLKLQTEGKIRYIAVSNCYRKEYKEYLKICNIVDNQIKYSMLDRKIERGIIDDCLENNIGIIAYSPLEQGILTGNMLNEKKIGKEDIRNSNAWFKKDKSSIIKYVISTLLPLAEKYKCSIAQLVIAWTVSKRGITSVLCGARTTSNALENVKAANVCINREDINKISKMTELRNLILNVHK